MKKVSIILDETTVFNFPFLWKLIKRYRFMSSLMPLVVLLLGGYFYSSQNLIYSTKVGFKNVAGETNSPTSAIAKLLGEKTSQLTPSEIIGMAKSPDFLHKVAKRLYEHPKFSKLNFNSIYAKNQKTQVEIFGDCHKDKDCILGKIRNKVGGLYQIQPDQVEDMKYHVVVKSLSYTTTEVLVRVVADVVQETRIDTIKHFLSEQRKISESLIEQKRDDLSKGKVKRYIERVKTIASKLSGIRNKLNRVGHLYENIKLEMHKAEIMNAETKDILDTKENGKARERYEKSKKLKERISELNEDIAALELNKDSFSSHDKSIVSQLQEELERKTEELKKLGKVDKNLARQERIMASKNKDFEFAEFDYNVVRKEFSRVRAEYESLLEKEESLLSEKLALEKKMEEHKPSLEYLKLLEGKLVQLRLLENTVVSDLIFDKFYKPVTTYKRTSKTNVAIFSLVLGFLILIVSILLRYMTDTRIYDEYELKKNFEDLEIIGNTPDFK